MPLSQLGELLSFAQEREIEKETIPLWIAHFAIQKIRGEEALTYDEFMNATKAEPSSSNAKSPENIIAEFDAIVAADRAKK